MAETDTCVRDGEIKVSDWISFKNISNHVCRICTTVTKFLVPIYEGEGVELELERKIKKYLPINIKTSDDYPLNVCFKCTESLVTWDKFVTVCYESDKKLKTLKGEVEDVDGDVSEVDNKDENSDMGGDSDNEPLSLHAKRKSSKMEDSVPKKRKVGLRKVKEQPTDVEEFDTTNIKTEVIDSSYDTSVNKSVSSSDGDIRCEQCGRNWN
jgi:hypothetical protein